LLYQMRQKLAVYHIISRRCWVQLHRFLYPTRLRTLSRLFPKATLSRGYPSTPGLSPTHKLNDLMSKYMSSTTFTTFTPASSKTVLNTSTQACLTNGLEPQPRVLPPAHPHPLPPTASDSRTRWSLM